MNKFVFMNRDGKSASPVRDSKVVVLVVVTTSAVDDDVEDAEAVEAAMPGWSLSMRIVCGDAE